MLAPRWAHLPLSSEGAALHGGRFNARQQATLYMSREIPTAIAEYEQDLGIRPGTLCAYDVDLTNIADLTSEAVRREIGVTPELLLSPWKQELLIEERTPRTWELAEQMLERGVHGILTPSVVHTSVNLVLWNWKIAPGQSIIALDPLGDLPRNQSSWQ